MANGFKLPDSTNIVGEASAISEGLNYCHEQGINHSIIELDSLAMVHILEGR